MLRFCGRSLVSRAEPHRRGRHDSSGQIERRRRERAGRVAEFFAAAVLVLTGHRILARRAKTPRGEIDIVAVRRGRLAFVEVKLRRTLALAEQAVTLRQAQRISAAANAWIAQHRRYQAHIIGLDRFEVAGITHLRHVPNAIQPTQ